MTTGPGPLGWGGRVSLGAGRLSNGGPGFERFHALTQSGRFAAQALDLFAEFADSVAGAAFFTKLGDGVAEPALDPAVELGGPSSFNG